MKLSHDDRTLIFYWERSKDPRFKVWTRVDIQLLDAIQAALRKPLLPMPEMLAECASELAEAAFRMGQVPTRDFGKDTLIEQCGWMATEQALRWRIRILLAEGVPMKAIWKELRRTARALRDARRQDKFWDALYRLPHLQPTWERVRGLRKIDTTPA